MDIKFDKVSKRYRVRKDSEAEPSRNPILRKIQGLRRPAQDFWALTDVSFEVERGETLGIIGHNGAGKSTILKLLANITSPTKGEIMINGRLSALIEVGSGFHPELTGRENIYLNGSILGMSRREITEKLDSIVEFAGISQFLDTPVKRFSSGMYVRLGFSIAAHLDPDILLLDEVLAVGDSAFQAKCLQRIGELKNAGTTIVFISHDLGAVERVCDRVVLMKNGKILTVGPARNVIDTYEKDSVRSSGGIEAFGIDGNKSAEIKLLTFRGIDGQDQPIFRTGEPLIARIEFRAHESIQDAVFEIIFHSPDGKIQCEFSSRNEKVELKPGYGHIDFTCPEVGLKPGIYYTDVSVKNRFGLESIHVQFRSLTLRVDPGKEIQGTFYMPHHWTIRYHDVPKMELCEVGARGSDDEA
jgi:ABC-type polysaccharide/polyol phosphate transport system ATPase subunit